MKKSILLVSTLLLVACSTAFGQQEEKKQNVQETENTKVKKVKKVEAKKVEKAEVKSAQPIQLRKEAINKRALVRKEVNVKANAVRKEKKED